MSCTNIRPLLPQAVYGDLAGEEAALVEAHLSQCPACQEELTALRQVRQQLAIIPVPAVHIDMARLYQDAAHRTTRRWRRWLFASAGVAAALWLGLLALNFELRIEAHQLVLRWGSPPLRDAQPRPAEESPPSVLIARQAPTAEVEQQMALLSQWVPALARDGERRDEEHAREIALLKARIALMQRQADVRLAAAERDVDTLYNIQFDKGADR
jgi:anti-sigma factor RsiW